MEFVVKAKGIQYAVDSKGSWVLAVDPAGERFLLSHDEDQSLHWHPMADCTFSGAATPDVPRLVLPVKAQEPQIIRPGVVPNQLRGNGAG